MPRVPTYDNLQVQQQELPPVRQEAPQHLLQFAGLGGAEMMNEGQNLEQAGRGFAQMQAVQNEATVKDQAAQFVNATSTVMNDPQAGYLSQLGANAVKPDSDNVTPAQKAMQAIQGIRDGMMNSLNDPVQKQLFKQVTDQHIASLNNQIMVHQAQQTKQYEMDSSAARASAGMNAAIAGYNPMLSPDNQSVDFKNNLSTQTIELSHQADVLGLTDPDERNKFVMYGPHGNDGLLNTYSGIVGHLIDNGQSKAATDFFNSVKDSLPATAADKINNDLKTALTKDDSLNLSLQLQGKSLNDQRNTLDTMFQNGEITAEVHDATMQRVEHNWQIGKAEEAENTKQVLGNAQDWLLHNPGKSVLDMPSSMYIALKSVGHLETVEGFANSLANKTTQDDPALYMALHQKANDGTLSETDVLAARGKVSNAHFNDLMNTYNALNKQDAKRMNIDNTINNALKVSDVMIPVKAAGLNPTAKPGTDAAQEYATFQASARDHLLQAFQDNPKLSQDQANNIIRGLVKDRVLYGTGVFGSSWFQSKSKGYQLTPEQNSARWDVPDAVRAKAISALQARGITNPTEAQINQVYQLAGY